MKMISTLRHRCQAVKNRNPLSLCFSNIRGLRGNFPQVEAFLHTRKPHFLALSESRLDSSVLSSDVSAPNYLVHRLDSAPSHGLIVYSHESLAITRLHSLESTSQYMAFRVCLPRSTHVLFFVYRSPASNSDIFATLSDSIDEALHMFPSATISVFGDFNVHHKDWLVHSRSTDSVGVAAFNFSLCHNLTQLVTSPTRIPDRDSDGSYLLDLFLTSHPDDFQHSVESPLGSSDHCVVSISTSFTPSRHEGPYHRTVLRYRDADWDGFRNFLADIPKAHLSGDPAAAAKELSEWIQVGIETYVPSKTYQVRPATQPWFTPECSAAIAHRNHYFHRYQRSMTTTNLRLFRQARASCKRVLLTAKANYASHTRSLVSSQRLGTKDFWKICNRVLNKTKSSSTPLVNADGSVSVSSDSKAQRLCDQFASNSTIRDAGVQLPSFPPRTQHSVSLPLISSKRVQKLIFELDSSKASGPDSIPVTVLRHCAPELSAILSKMFNLSLKTCTFPTCWKQAVVVPVPKKGDLTSAANYRPISLLSVVGKIFERILNEQIWKHLETHKLLSDVQFGFRHQRSSADLLALLTEHISKVLDQRGESRSVALDISKAFDRVWHAGLLHKLSSYGIDEKFLSLIASFLSDRSMSVVVNGCRSQPCQVNAGVPQGSILGPTLFLLYINDLPENVLSKIVLYADDATLFDSATASRSDSNSRSGLCSRLDADLLSIERWGAKWLVNFNSSKTQDLQHSRLRREAMPDLSMSNEKIRSVSSSSILGVTIAHDLSWATQIRNIGKRASQRIGSLYRSRSFLTPEACLYLYKSTIRPIMEYCCHLWSGAPKSHLSFLDRVQHRMKKLVGSDLYSTLQPLSQRRDVASLSLFYRYYFGRCSDGLHTTMFPAFVASRSTRRTNSLHSFSVQVPRSRTVSRSSGFFVRTANQWNSLPAQCFPDRYDLSAFKRRVNAYLKSV